MELSTAENNALAPMVSRKSALISGIEGAQEIGLQMSVPQNSDTEPEETQVIIF